MMLVKERIQRDMITAMKEKNKQERDLLRFIMSQLKQKEVDSQSEISESDAFAVIRKEIKQTQEVRKISDSPELEWRVAFLEKYLPAQLSEGAIYQIVAEYKIGQPDMKIAMKDLMARLGDIADRKVISETIRRVYN